MYGSCACFFLLILYAANSWSRCGELYTAQGWYSASLHEYACPVCELCHEMMIYMYSQHTNRPSSMQNDFFRPRGCRNSSRDRRCLNCPSACSRSLNGDHRRADIRAHFGAESDISDLQLREATKLVSVLKDILAVELNILRKLQPLMRATCNRSGSGFNAMTCDEDVVKVLYEMWLERANKSETMAYPNAWFKDGKCLANLFAQRKALTWPTCMIVLAGVVLALLMDMTLPRNKTDLKSTDSSLFFNENIQHDSCQNAEHYEKPSSKADKLGKWKTTLRFMFEYRPSRKITITVLPFTLNQYVNEVVNDHREPNQLMKYEWSRYMSFKDFPKESKVTPMRLAQAGFFSTGRGEEAECFCCGVKNDQWSEEESTWQVHRRLSPDCRFVRGESSENVPIHGADYYTSMDQN